MSLVNQETDHSLQGITKLSFGNKIVIKVFKLCGGRSKSVTYIHTYIQCRLSQVSHSINLSDNLSFMFE